MTYPRRSLNYCQTFQLTGFHNLKKKKKKKQTNKQKNVRGFQVDTLQNAGVLGRVYKNAALDELKPLF